MTDKTVLTKDEFEQGYASRSNVTVDELHRLGVFAMPCDCGEDDCHGWQMSSISRLHEHDEITITATTTNGHRLKNIEAVVSTISPADDDAPAAIKIWPVDESLGDGSGKLWIWVKDIEQLTIRHSIDDEE